MPLEWAWAPAQHGTHRRRHDLWAGPGTDQKPHTQSYISVPWLSAPSPTCHWPAWQKNTALSWAVPSQGPISGGPPTLPVTCTLCGPQAQIIPHCCSNTTKIGTHKYNEINSISTFYLWDLTSRIQILQHLESFLSFTVHHSGLPTKWYHCFLEAAELIAVASTRLVRIKASVLGIFLHGLALQQRTRMDW